MVLLPFIKNKRKLLWPVTMMVIYNNLWKKGTGLPDRGPEEINTMGVYSLHAFGDLLKQNRLWWASIFIHWNSHWGPGREKESTAFFGKQAKYIRTNFGGERLSKMLRENLWLKASKSQWKLPSLKFILSLIVHNPQMKSLQC